MIFDAYEIHPIEEWADAYGTYRDTARNPDMASYWSLFGHLPAGGLECLADCESRAAAEHLLAGLEAAGQLRACLQRAEAALNSAPRHRRGGIDTYRVAAEVGALLRRLPALPLQG